MSTHQSQVPPAAARYFEGVTDIDPTDYSSVSWYKELHPTIAATFVPGRGWKSYGYQKRISASWVRKLRDREGVTALALRCKGRVADFSAAELLRRS